MTTLALGFGIGFKVRIFVLGIGLACCDFLEWLCVNFLQKTINHLTMVHMPRGIEIFCPADIGRIILV